MRALRFRETDAKGFMLIELMIVLTIVFALASIAMPMYSLALQRGRQAGLTAEGKKLYNGLMAYYSDNAAFPSEGVFDNATLVPLSSSGYLNNPEAVVRDLVDGELLIYLAPDIDGADQQFIAILQMEKDPDVVVAVVHTNTIDEDDGWYDGVFVIDQDDLADAGL